MEDKKTAMTTTAAPAQMAEAPTFDLQAVIDTPAGIFDPRVVAAIAPVARMMSKSGPAVPAWLRDNEGGCFAVCVDAARWGVNPFGLARDSFCVGNGTPSYGGKATYAVIQRCVGDLDHEYIGDWSKVQGMGIVVWRGKKRLTLMLTQCTVRNSTNWANNPQLQLYYQACKIWGRMFAPAALLGFYTADEMPDSPVEIQNVTPMATPASAGKVVALKERLGIPAAVAEKQDGPKRSEIIFAELKKSGAPVSYADVESYLKAHGVGDIDNPETWGDQSMLSRFDADPEKAVKAIADKIVDSELV